MIPHTDYIADQHTDDGLYTYTVIFTNDEAWEYFVCEAENGEHAEEQAVDAEPDATILWVNRGLNFSQENVYEVTITAKITKTITVNALTEDQAAEDAHQVFSVLNDGDPENYEQDTDSIELVWGDN